MLRALIVENDPSDVELMAHALRSGGYEVRADVAESREQFLMRLSELQPDVVLADYRLPTWTGMEALEALKALKADVPFILVTGTLGEERAVECMKQGAADYVLKKNVARLPMAVERALAEQLARRELVRAERQLREAQQQVRDREERFRRLIEHSADGISLLDARGKVIYRSPASERILGAKLDPRADTNFIALLHPDDVPRAREMFETVLEKPEARAKLEVRFKHGDGSWRWVESIVTNLLSVPHVNAIVANYRDVTERHNAVAALRESEERFREIAEHIKEAFFVVDLATFKTLYISPTWAEIWGRPLSEGYDPKIWIEAIHPDDREAVQSSQQAAKEGGKSDSQFRVIRPDGKIRWVHGRAFPVRDASGKVTRLVGLSADITELRQAEERFAQAQKMEAVGQLAGGVAHDFNNLLTIIMGETELMQHEIPRDSAHWETLQAIYRAGESAASLTRQLLAFSRKQLIEPTVFSLNDVVADMSKMLRRLIGEDVRLETRLDAQAGTVRADRGQVEQILTNLAVNARDAMPRGGVLLLETATSVLDADYAAHNPEVVPGEYALLAVSDTGTGMTPEVKARIFDPFFTTKERGKGTGLGLAMCHGAVKQAGGHIAAYSEPGVGTTFRVYLPRVREEPTAERAAHEKPVLPRGNETILMVEDDDMVRRVGSRMLRDLGYVVLEARNATEAQEQLFQHRDAIRLLFTDVVLPGASGRELAELVEKKHPTIRILFTSGYSDDVILQNQLLAHNVALVQKPYARQALARKVREVLDSPLSRKGVAD